MKNNKLGDEEWKGMNKIYKLGSSEKGITVSSDSPRLPDVFISLNSLGGNCNE